MKKLVLLSLLFVSTMSISEISLAFGLAEALKPTIHKTNKDVSQVDKTTKVKKSREIIALEKILADWVDAFNNKDIATLMSFYDQKAIFASPNLEVIKGVDDIKAWYETHFAEIDGNLKYMPVSITEKSGLGTVILTFYIEPHDSSKPRQEFKGRAMLVFKKKFLGNWLLLNNMVHVAPELLITDFQ